MPEDKKLPRGWWAAEHWAITHEAAKSIAALETEAQARTSVPSMALGVSEATIPLVGVLGARRWGWKMGSDYQEVVEAARAADADLRVSTIVFDIDSPGGLVKGAHEAAVAISELRKPTLARVSGQACSAAYWLAAACDTIEASPTSQLGSVGTAIMLWAPKDDEKFVVEIVASQSPRKNASPRSKDGRGQYQAVLDAQAEVFLSDVAHFRGVEYTEVAEKYGAGAILSAPAALAAGMIDKIVGVPALEPAEGDDMPDPTEVVALKADLASTKAALETANALNATQAEEAKAIQANAEVTSLKADLEATQTELEAAKAQTPEPSAELRAVKDELATVKADLATAKAAGGVTPDATKPEDGAGAEIEGLKASLATANADLATVRAELDGIKAQGSDVEVSPAEGELATAQAALESAKTELATAQALNATQAEEASRAAEAEAEAVRGELATAKAELATAEALNTAQARDARIDGMVSNGFLAPAEKAVATHIYSSDKALFESEYGSRTAPVVNLGRAAHGGTPPPVAEDPSPAEKAKAEAAAYCEAMGYAINGGEYYSVLTAAQNGTLPKITRKAQE